MVSEESFEPLDIFAHDIDKRGDWYARCPVVFQFTTELSVEDYTGAGYDAGEVGDLRFIVLPFPGPQFVVVPFDGI